MNRQYRWKLEVYWSGGWRLVMESDDRHMLMDYAQSCAEDLQLRIVDTKEEVKKRD